MRMRGIKPEFITDEEVASWPTISRLAYIFMWMEADDCGRLRANSSYLGSVLFPYEKKVNMEVVLQPIKDSGKLVTWEAIGQTWGLLPNFLIHQNINRGKFHSKIPDPPDEIQRSVIDRIEQRHGIISDLSVTVQRAISPSRARAESGIRNQESGIRNPPNPQGGLEVKEWIREFHRKLMELGKCPDLKLEALAMLARECPKARLAETWEEALTEFGSITGAVQHPVQALRRIFQRAELRALGSGKNKDSAERGGEVSGVVRMFRGLEAEA